MMNFSMITGTSTKKIRNINGISEVQYLNINNTRQYVLIRGENVNNPILLFLHGGPGASATAMLRKLNSDLEKHFTKNQILELYLNIAEFGPDIFGVHAASRYYFKKRPSKINAAEGAFLSLMLPSPRRNHYSLFQNRNLTPNKKRKLRRVLRGMVSEGFISQKQYNRYVRYNFFKYARKKKR